MEYFSFTASTPTALNGISSSNNESSIAVPAENASYGTNDNVSLITLTDSDDAVNDDDMTRIASALIAVPILGILVNTLFPVLVKCDVRLHHMTYVFVASWCVLNVIMSLTSLPIAIAVSINGERLPTS